MNFREICPAKLFPVLMVLESRSENVFVVGGAVRDIVSEKTPKDWDLVTDTPMEELIPLFEEGGFKVKQTGVAHFVLNVTIDHFEVEVSNFRKDVVCDGRQAEVEVGTIEDDAFRRDFTINAVYINTRTLEMVDPTGLGIQDLAESTLRFVGKPKDRIREDYLRVWRLMRFAAKGFTPEPRSLRAVRELWNEAYEKTTPERVRMEVEKMAGL